MKSNYGSSVFYKLKQISLEPDKYGKHLKIKMVSAYTGDGKFIKHVKLDEDMLNLKVLNHINLTIIKKR